VVFKSDETVDLVMSSGPHEINHKIVDVKRAQARGQAPPSIHNVVAASGGGGGGEAAFNAAMGGGGSGGGGGQPSAMTAEQLKCKVSLGKASEVLMLSLRTGQLLIGPSSHNMFPYCVNLIYMY